MTSARKLAVHPFHEKMLEKLQSKGLTEEHAERLERKPLTREEVQAALKTDRPQPAGMLIPYFDVHGKKTSFFRIRYLEKPLGFAGQVEKPQRYVQPAKTLNEVYMPPLLPDDAPWAEVQQNASITIYFTEGEDKAACGCTRGFHVIGLGGVDLWRSTKRGLDLLPQLKDFDWKNRNVVIVFDSDAASNPNVARAQRQLGEELVNRGALVTIISLPSGKDSKQGLDDWILAVEAAGGDLVAEMMKLIEDAGPWSRAAALHEMNETALYVMDPGGTLRRETGQLLRRDKFVNEMFSDHFFTERVGEKVKRIPTAKAWMEWPGRFKVPRLTYAPGQPQLVNGEWNLWPGWGIEPAEGPYQWWLDHLGKLTDNEPAMFHHLLCRFAWMLQNPSIPGYGIFTFSYEKGTGKSSLVFPFTGFEREKIVGIFGKNAAILESQHLKSEFNGRTANKQFILGEEILGDAPRNRRAYADRLKNLISNPVVTINEKFAPAYDVPNLINWYLTSQHDDGALLERGDRRWACLHPPEKRLERPYSSRYFAAMKDPRNIAGLFHYLLTLKIPEYAKKNGITFDREDPPYSRAKLEVIDASRTRLEHLIAELREHPEDVLAQVQNAPFTREQITSAPLWRLGDLHRVWREIEIKGDERNKVDPQTFGRWLTKGGIIAVNKREKVRARRWKWDSPVPEFKLYALRDREKWEKASEAECWGQWSSDFPDVLETLKTQRVGERP